ncbi:MULTISPECIES: hypothetical protein [Streptomyces]|uniref:Uncharacterized protein n=1 Tax=Streptomyces alboniger TaxID=132473 RepID=A0A5J6HS00_STRAD|nr:MULTISPECIES: hypothetical protein [Streptomyces]QEV21644.1 hypothetical protein CP975_32645 [Streptomyces alboniger]
MSTPPTPPSDPGPANEALLSQRTALILLMAAFFSTVVGVLTLLSTGGTAGALLAGLAAFGGCTIGLHSLIGR